MLENKRGRFSLDSIQSILAILVILASTVAISYIDRTNFSLLFTLYSAAFIAFLTISKKDFNLKEILLITFGLRIFLVFSFPNLSDDIYRFMWDGNIMQSDFKSVYALLPHDALGSIEDCDLSLYDKLNSKEFYSVYPPIMQICFYISGLLSGGSLILATTFLKIILIASEIGVVYFLIKILTHFSLNMKWSLLYACNPLIILETVGNCHFEGMMIYFVLWAWYLLISAKVQGFSNYRKAGLLISLGIMTKLTCLLFIPMLFTRIRNKDLLIFTIFTIIGCALLIFPFLSESFISNFSNSLDLYFRKFKFNASVFYVVNGIASARAGYDTVQSVGPLLSVIAIVLMLILTFKNKINWHRYFVACLLGYTGYLLLSTTVHPWYIINLIFLSVLTRYKFPIIWSFLIILSYYMYGNERVEPLWALMVQYGILYVFIIMEIRNKKRFTDLFRAVPLFPKGDILKLPT